MGSHAAPAAAAQIVPDDDAGKAAQQVVRHDHDRAQPAETESGISGDSEIDTNATPVNEVTAIAFVDRRRAKESRLYSGFAHRVGVRLAPRVVEDEDVVGPDPADDEDHEHAHRVEVLHADEVRHRRCRRGTRS